jgi:hypothetical protein
MQGGGRNNEIVFTKKNRHTIEINHKLAPELCVLQKKILTP